MYCGECGYLNREGVRYCARCGTLIETGEAVGESTEMLTPEDQAAHDGGDEPHHHGSAVLVVKFGGGRQGEHLPLRAERETIGRHPGSSLFLDDVTVSRNHAVIERAGDEYEIADLESLNGTYVNRQRIERARLRDGDEVQIGKFKLTYLES